MEGDERRFSAAALCTSCLLSAPRQGQFGGHRRLEDSGSSPVSQPRLLRSARPFDDRHDSAGRPRRALNAPRPAAFALDLPVIRLWIRLAPPALAEALRAAAAGPSSESGKDTAVSGRRGRALSRAAGA
ncbi:hypothetical protein SKAU_G00107280 [Synaphobranchus kaupii]|uniref:Uncharacterized protein n=1 Tax=Synaphobranchus kaupii TaxID=118154 RepID=A0A9Q1FZR1_SYNKA|nr:hypothetical protein SKAU_G00107280 [Synaphobranchus kaupii]